MAQQLSPRFASASREPVQEPVYFVEFALDGPFGDAVRIYSSSIVVGWPSDITRPYLDRISGLSQSITPNEGKSSIGSIKFTVADDQDDVSGFLGDYSATRLWARLWAGYRAVSLGDYAQIYAGKVRNVRLSGDLLSYEFAVADVQRDLGRPLTLRQSDKKLQGNPIQVLHHILEGLVSDASCIDAGSFDEIQEHLFAGQKYDFSVTEDTEIDDAKKWLEQNILRPCNCYLVVGGDGCLSLRTHSRYHYHDKKSVLAIDSRDIVGLPRWDLNLGSVVHSAEITYHSSKGLRVYTGLASNQPPPEEKRKTFKLESKAIKEEWLARQVARKVLDRFAQPAPVIQIQVLMASRLCPEGGAWRMLGAGDIVALSHPQLPDLDKGQRGLWDTEIEVIKVTPDFKSGRVKITLLGGPRVAPPPPNALIAPNTLDDGHPFPDHDTAIAVDHTLDRYAFIENDNIM